MEKMFYKVAVLFKGSLTEEEANAEYTKVTEELKIHGVITQEVKPNKIVLAYPIAKSTEAYFATVKFEPAENTTLDFKDWLKKADVLRVLITKNDNVTVEKVTGFSPALKA
ncbi:MAG TPA: 30S ribosomal protein S6, partial [Candidatus Paceibacterota bacterium]|nr:30S ribosomal protein S6 [Candidatus Paceibacterota bacterium]